MIRPFCEARRAAELAGEKWFSNGKPCRNGHTSMRLVSNGNCRECNKQWSKAFYRDKHGSSAAVDEG
jgi:hypothetical protein